MKISASRRKDNIINNIDYIIKSRGETKVSFSHRTGVTRATLYKILEGKVNNVQRSTITRIADFFGVSCEVIENYDLAHIETVERTLSPDGDKNPAAIPVIPQSAFLASSESRIGQLVTQYPVTWYFGDTSNTVALQVENNINNMFFPEDILIIKRNALPSKKQLALVYSPQKEIFLTSHGDPATFDAEQDSIVLGAVIEERIR